MRFWPKVVDVYHDNVLSDVLVVRRVKSEPLDGNLSLNFLGVRDSPAESDFKHNRPE